MEIHKITQLKLNSGVPEGYKKKTEAKQYTPIPFVNIFFDLKYPKKKDLIQKKT